MAALGRLIPAVRPTGLSRSAIPGPSRQVPRYLRTIASTTRRYTSASTSTSSPTPTRPCPSCSAPLPIPSSPCPKCSTLIPIPSGLSHHSLLNLSQPVVASAAFSTPFDLPAELSTLPAYGFELDVKDLRGRMLKRQMELHPDKFSGEEKQVALARELSGRVNGAYETLKDPLRRAEYLVSLVYFHSYFSSTHLGAPLLQESRP